MSTPKLRRAKAREQLVPPLTHAARALAMTILVDGDGTISVEVIGATEPVNFRLAHQMLGLAREHLLQLERTAFMHQAQNGTSGGAASEHVEPPSA